MLPQRFFFLSPFVPEPIWIGRKTSPLTDILCISFISNLLSKNILTRTVYAYIHILYIDTHNIYIYIHTHTHTHTHIHTYICSYAYIYVGFPGDSDRKEPPYNAGYEWMCMYVHVYVHTHTLLSLPLSLWRALIDTKFSIGSLLP